MKYFKNCLVILLISVSIFNLTGCDGDKEMIGRTSDLDETIKIVDCAGRQVELKEEAERIVDLTFLEGVRTLIELGAQNHLVGMSDMDHQAFNPNGVLKNYYIIVSQIAPELKNIANVGSHEEPNIEKIMSLNPDVIFVEWSRQDYADTLQNQINIPVVCVGGYGSFNYEIFSVVGKIVGKEERAEELISFTKSKIKAVTDITKDISKEEKKKIYYWVRPYIGDPRTNGRYEAFELAGGRNVAAEGDTIPYGVYKVTKEQIAAWNPEYIFRHSAFLEDIEGWHTIDTIKKDAVIRSTKAVSNNNVFPTKGHMRGWDIATESTEVFYLAKILYPEKFPNLDVELVGNEILEKFYGIKGLYTDMSNKIGLYQWK